MLAPAERCSLALSSLWGFSSHGSFHPFCFSPCTQSPPAQHLSATTTPLPQLNSEASEIFFKLFKAQNPCLAKESISLMHTDPEQPRPSPSSPSPQQTRGTGTENH